MTTLDSLPKQSVVFVSIASKDLVIPTSDFHFRSDPLSTLVALVRSYPHLAFLTPSIANYALIQNAQFLGSKPKDVLPTDYGFWQDQCEAFLKKADCLLLLPTNNWAASTGVKAELDFAFNLNKPVILDEFRPVYSQTVYAEAQSFISTNQ